MEGLEHPNIKKLTLDVTNAEHIEDAVSTVVAAEGKIDILFNNAGAVCAGTFNALPLLTAHILNADHLAGPMLDITLEQVRDTFETNTFAALAMCRAVIPHMARRQKGLVVNVGSVMGDM